MTLRHLNIYVTVCNYNSMTSAAKHLFISQPSVSQAISELENYYNVKLFNRISKKLYITSVGIKVLEHAKKILELTDELKTITSSDAENIKETIKVGASITIGDTFFADIISRFETHNFRYRIETAVKNVADVKEMVLNGQLDAGIVATTAITKKELDVVSLHMDNLVLVCSKNQEFPSQKNISLSELAKLPLILREKGSDVRDMIENEVMELNVIGEYNDFTAILKALKANLGFSVLPKVFIAQGQNEDLHWMNIDSPMFQREYLLISNKNNANSLHVSAFKNFCIKYKSVLNADNKT